MHQVRKCFQHKNYQFFWNLFGSSDSVFRFGQQPLDGLGRDEVDRRKRAEVERVEERLVVGKDLEGEGPQLERQAMVNGQHSEILDNQI